MGSQLVETGHTLPNPGRSEADIAADVAAFRADIVARGGVVISERRVRNPVFDRRGERTTTVLRVDWSRSQP